MLSIAPVSEEQRSNVIILTRAVKLVDLLAYELSVLQTVEQGTVDVINSVCFWDSKSQFGRHLLCLVRIQGGERLQYLATLTELPRQFFRSVTLRKDNKKAPEIRGLNVFAVELMGIEPTASRVRF